MKKILLVLPDLGHSHFGRQLALLAPRLPRDYQLQVVSLNGAGPNARPLQDAGIPVFGQAGQRLFDVEDWLTLRRRVTESNPDLIHVFGLAALRTLRLACLGRYGKLRLLCSPGTDVRKPLGAWTLRLLRGCEALVVSDSWERKQLEALEVDASFIRSLPPAVEVDGPARNDQSSRDFVLCVSGFDSPASPRDAVWDFDILRYTDPSLRLVMVGEGPAVRAVEHFGRRLAREDHRVEYLGSRDDVRDLMRRARFVWISNRKPSGTNVALEAMAAGTPVVASDLPNLRALMNREPTLTLVPPGAPTSLARATRHLMLNPDVASRRAEAASRYVRERHDANRVAGELGTIYRSLVG
jgi:glycosyltransferase involved in cell wall biosynthesis